MAGWGVGHKFGRDNLHIRVVAVSDRWVFLPWLLTTDKASGVHDQASD